MKKYLALFLLMLSAAAFVACGDTPNGSTASNAVQHPNDTPTEAYKRLFAAVKSKNTEAIKAEFSKNSIAAAQAQASRVNVPVEEVYKNGFTATTFSETLPEIRDQRINGDMGAIEVWNSQDSKWEDLPYIREETGWKLAVGEAFSGAWKRPGMGRAMRELNASNASTANRSMVNAMPKTNVNMNQMIANARANVNTNK